MKTFANDAFLSGLTALELSDNRLSNLEPLAAMAESVPNVAVLHLAENSVRRRGARKKPNICSKPSSEPQIREVRQLEHVRRWRLTALKTSGNPMEKEYKTAAEFQGYYEKTFFGSARARAEAEYRAEPSAGGCRRRFPDDSKFRSPSISKPLFSVCNFFLIYLLQFTYAGLQNDFFRLSGCFGGAKFAPDLGNLDFFPFRARMPFYTDSLVLFKADNIPQTPGKTQEKCVHQPTPLLTPKNVFPQISHRFTVCIISHTDFPHVFPLALSTAQLLHIPPPPPRETDVT